MSLFCQPLRRRPGQAGRQQDGERAPEPLRRARPPPGGLQHPGGGRQHEEPDGQEQGVQLLQPGRPADGQVGRRRRRRRRRPNAGGPGGSQDERQPGAGKGQAALSRRARPQRQDPGGREQRDGLGRVRRRGGGGRQRHC